MEEEIWKSIIEADGYEISNLGRVRSLDRVVRLSNNINYRYKGVMLKPGKNRDGYLSVSIPIQKKFTSKLISRLLADAFIPNPNNYPCVLHKNDIKTDNRIENLYWGTQKMNMNDKIVNSQLYGDNHHRSKITVAQANEIRELIKEGKLTLKAIGAKYGITRSAVGLIKNNSSRKYDNL